MLDLFVEPVDEVDLGADGVDAGRAVADVVDDELGRAVGVGGVDDLLGAFRVDDDSDAGMFLAGALDLVDSEADVDGAVACQSRILLCSMRSSVRPPLILRGLQTAVWVLGSMPRRLPVFRPRCWSGKKRT